MHVHQITTDDGRTGLLLVPDKASGAACSFDSLLGWLEKLGLVILDKDGRWRVTELGEAGLARLRGNLH
jgi:DNA-binding transcriptional ArsR family regulator